jgi:hypothetical protein
MRFFIDKEARRAYLFADTKVEEVSIKTIYAHITGPMPNTVRLIERQETIGLQAIPMHLEFMDSSSRARF